MAGRVANDELARFGGEVAVGHVDGDALLALGARPSVSRARSVLARRCTPARWSCSTARLSTSRRPISVLLPSSTLPQVMNEGGFGSLVIWAPALAG